MRVLVACEESQVVCKAFREKGHEAYSCDIQECSGGHPEWHFKQDVFEVIENNGPWDLMIAHPPCTYLSYAGNGWFNIEKYGDKAKQRIIDREEALQFFIKLWKVNIPRICIENPRGYAGKFIQPRQLIHPYYFGDSDKKLTHLWLKNLPRLQGLIEVAENKKKYEPEPIYIDKSGKKRYFTDAHSASAKGGQAERRKERSKTFPGIARAMAEQWG